MTSPPTIAHHRASLLGFAALAMILGGCSERSESSTPAPDAPTFVWAERVNHPDLPNLHQVGPTIWRGAQPDADGMAALEKLGVRTVISLRAFHGDSHLLEDTGLAYERISFKTWHPEDEDVIRFLAIVTDPERHPVFIHCLHGSDRTGTMCAIYRMVIQDWPREEAIREMIDGGFGYHRLWVNLPLYLRQVDIDRIRDQVGLSATRAVPTAHDHQPASHRP